MRTDNDEEEGAKAIVHRNLRDSEEGGGAEVITNCLFL